MFSLHLEMYLLPFFGLCFVFVVLFSFFFFFRRSGGVTSFEHSPSPQQSGPGRLPQRIRSGIGRLPLQVVQGGRTALRKQKQNCGNGSDAVFVQVSFFFFFFVSLPSKICIAMKS